MTSIDTPGRRTMFRALMVIVALEPLIIIAILAAAGIPWWMIAAVLASIAFVAAFAFWLVVVVMWRPIARRYPARPILPGAVSKAWQSFAFGALSRLNNCITIIADERHLHLQPFAPMRWAGAGTVSLPFDRMSSARRSIVPGHMVADLDGRTITGPAWCLRLAGGGADQPDAA